MSEDRLRVLVTNDDGIEAPGLWCQAEAWATVADVLVVAPTQEQSGAGTSFTYRRELTVQEVEPRVAGVRAFSLDGTPSDCVTVGLRRLATGRVGVISAGVNTGANLGRGVLAAGGRLPTEPLLNVNIPTLPLTKVRGYRFTRMATSHYQRLIEEVGENGA